MGQIIDIETTHEEKHSYWMSRLYYKFRKTKGREISLNHT